MKSAFLLVWAADAGLGPPPWAATAVYLWLAMLCAWAWRERRGPTGRLDSLAWLGLAAIFAGLAVARPLGLQWKLADAFRQRAVEGNWYEIRRRFQAAAILAAVALAALGVVAIAAAAAWRRSWRTSLAFAPVAALLGFLAVRAVSFHYVDRALYRTVAGVEVNAMVELALLGLVAAGLVRRALGARDGAPTSVVARDEGAGARGRWSR